jgi:hypothetical protein
MIFKEEVKEPGQAENSVSLNFYTGTIAMNLIPGTLLNKIAS